MDESLTSTHTPDEESNPSDLSESDVVNQYEDLFKESLGTFTGPKVKILVDDNTEPKFYKARPLPFTYKSLVEEEIVRLEKQGIIKPVKFSEWAAPLVPVMKPGGSVRLCGDYSVIVNKFAKKDAYPIPHIEDLYQKLSHGVVYTKLDLSQAYQQLLLDESSCKFTTVKGLYEYTHLPLFGISSAPGIFQRTMENLLQGIPMCCVYLDDILVSGKSIEEHDQNLKMVLDRLESHDLRVKKSKCSFKQKSVEYLGHKLDKDGIRPTEKKFDCIQKAPPPRNINELRSYLGILNYYHRFINNLSTELAPLYLLLRNEIPWKWEKAQKEAFLKSKNLLKSSKLLVHYDKDLPLIISCDASPVGIAAILSH